MLRFDRCCYWILTTELDSNLHAVSYWAKMELTTALKSGLAVVSALEGVVIAVNLFSLMGFLFSVFSFNGNTLILEILIVHFGGDFHCNFKKIVKPSHRSSSFQMQMSSSLFLHCFDAVCFVYNFLKKKKSHLSWWYEPLSWVQMVVYVFHEFETTLLIS